MTTDLELTKEQEAMFQPGCFVALHPDHGTAEDRAVFVSRSAES